MSLLAAVFLSFAVAQAAPDGAAVAPPVQPAPAVLHLPAGTPVEVEMAETISSLTSHLADRFSIRLAAPVVRDGVEVVASGAPGQGEVIDVARAGISGKQGKLIISARYLDLNGQQVRVRGLTLMTSGKSRVDLATGVMLVPYVGVASILIKGGEIEIPAGARATVRLAEDVDLPLHATQP